MKNEDKIELIKKCFIGTTKIDNEDWDDMLKEEDGFRDFLNSICLAMDIHFNKQAVHLLRFLRNGYRPQAPNLREWYDEKRKVVISEDGVLVSFGLSENIKKKLSEIKVQKNESVSRKSKKL